AVSGLSLQRHRLARDARESRLGSGENSVAMTPAEAARFITGHCQPLPTSHRPLRETLDTVLAEDVASPIDLPPWDNSAMDGYAVRSADLEQGNLDLEVIERVAAGQFPTKVVGKRQALRIFTDAALPRGEDAVYHRE